MAVPTSGLFREERLGRVEEIEQDHFWFVGRRRLVAHLVDRVRAARPVGRALDCGCGTGRTVATLRTRGLPVVGIDLHCRSVTPGLQAQGVLPQLPVASGSIDLALALDVLEHVDDDAALQEMRRLLSPGGALIVTVPAHRWLWGPRDEIAGHRRRYSRPALADLLTRNGFTIELLAWYQALLLPVVILSRLLSRFGSDLTTAEESVSPNLNRLLTRINLSEVAAFERGLRLPFGSSLLAVARRP